VLPLRSQSSRDRPTLSRRRGWEFVVTLGALALPLCLTPRALALDTLRARVTVDWGDVPCLERVVRSENPVFHFDWSIEEEVTMVPEDEPPQSRRFQFLAIDRQNAGTSPDWITEADIAQVHAIDPSFGDPGPEEIWELSPNWPAGSWLRVTPDAERIPITLETAAAGVDWDTSGIPSGAYQLLGYTWDPPINLTRARQGLVKVVDTTDELGKPALYIDPWGESAPTAPEGSELLAQICVDAPSGSTLEAYIAAGNPNARSNEDFEWIAATLRGFEGQAEAMTEVAIEIPELGVGASFEAHRLRIDITDPEGASYTAIAPQFFNVAAGDGEPPPGETGGSANEDSGEGCACRAQPRNSSLLGLLLLPAFAGRRRKLARLTRGRP
jgi:hypothetical protein